MNEYQLRNQIADKIKEINLYDLINRNPRRPFDNEKTGKIIIKEVLRIVLDMDLCEVCDELEIECNCVYCKSCGRKELQDEIYEGKCGACEDSQMVRGIL